MSGTDLIKHPGISAAGASHEMLKYTAALDAEFIYHGSTKTQEHLPISPSGIVSPALIAKACLNILKAPFVIVDTGAQLKPQCAYVNIREKPSASIETGLAIGFQETENLFYQGKKFLAQLTDHGFDSHKHTLMIAECVVGGTTTAFAVLKTLGYNCDEMVSSSIPEGNHPLKFQLLKQAQAEALKRDKDFFDKAKTNPLYAISAVGDPMQAFVLGLTVSCIEQNQKLILAGATQMLAILICVKALGIPSSSVTLATTAWVRNDKSAKFPELVSLCDLEAKLVYSDLEKIDTEKLSQEIKALQVTDEPAIFWRIINSYSQGHVKEGVGLGGLLYCLPLGG